jgi:hypothetical protein
MEKGAKIGITLVIGLVIGIGSFGGTMYYGATNLEVDINDVKLKSYTLPTLFNLKGSMTLEIEGEITSPTGISVSIDSGIYKLYIEKEFLGDGVIDPFTATKDPSKLTSTLVITELSAAGIAALTKINGGQNITVKIVITSITVYGMAVDTNIEQEESIAVAL